MPLTRTVKSAASLCFLLPVMAGVRLRKETNHMEQEETREQQYLCILESGPSGKDDYEAVRYLKDKGYTESPVQISYMDETYNQVLDVVWLGPSSTGIDFMDELKAKIAQRHTQQLEAAEKNNELKNENKSVPDNRQWDEKPLGKLGLRLFEAALVVFLLYLIGKHLGITPNS